MLTKSIALLNIIGLLIVDLFLLADIHITHEAPAIMNAGSEMKVTVTIEKGDLAGFAKLQIDLPPGLSATAIETKGASFTFADGKAKFIWMALPSQPRFQVSYTLTADASASGSLNINGRLSYIEDNERKTHDMSTSTVQVIGGAAAQVVPAAVEQAVPRNGQPPATSDGTADAGTVAAGENEGAPPTPPEQAAGRVEAANDVVSAAGAAPIVPALEPPPPGPPAVIQPMPGQGGVSGTRTITAVTETEMLVEVTIHKGAIRGFGKLQEVIPTGFTALEKSNDEAIFTTQGTIVKFVWLNLPAKADLKVVYKLRGNAQPEGDYQVSGDFGYLLNDETQKAVLGSTAFKIGPQALAQQQQAQPVDTQQVARQEPVKEPVQEPVKEPVATSVTPKIPTPETGITYKVQISAAHREVGRDYFQARHRFGGDFSIERHEGWIKYTTGRYSAYREARDQRVAYISAGHDFPGPFVTAYNNGDRITVQEALMISGQHWVQ